MAKCEGLRHDRRGNSMLKLGLIGLGEVAQMIHLPILHRLSGLFDLSAAYDPSASVAAAVARRWGIGQLHGSVEALLADAALDAVMVLSPDQFHGHHTRLALTAGKHVLLEKPSCLTRSDLDLTMRAADQVNRVVMVGYMRRYAAGFLAAKAAMRADDPPIYVRVRDVICEGPWYIRQVDQVISANGDIDPALLAESSALRARMLDEVLGADAEPDLRTAYQVLTGLSSHGLSAMRDILGGRPKRVTSASVKRGGTQISALLDYGDFTAIYECLIGDVVRFEAGIEITTAKRRIALEFPTPYLRNLPMWVDVQSSDDDQNQLTRLGPFHHDPFEAELRAFHACMTTGAANRTPLRDSVDDLDLFAEIIGAVARGRA